MVTIENLSNRPVLIELNSGDTLYLMPRATSKAILEVEIEGNARVAKLRQRGVIDVAEGMHQPQVATKNATPG